MAGIEIVTGTVDAEDVAVILRLEDAEAAVGHELQAILTELAFQPVVIDFVIKKMLLQ